jgi:hypothetical protein
MAWRRTASLDSRRQIAFAGTVLFVYGAYSVFMFDTPAVLVATFLGIALIGAHYAEAVGRSRPDPKAPVRSRVHTHIVLPLVVVLAAVAWAVNIAPARKYAQVQDAGNEVSISRSRALKMYVRAFSGYDPYLQDMRVKGLESLQVWSENASLVSPQMEALLRFMAAQTVEAAAVRDYNVRFQLVAAAAHRMLGTYDPKALDIAERYAQRALAAGPNRFNAYFEIAEIALARSQADEALSNLRLADERIPLKNSVNHGYVYYRMACAHALKCDADAAHTALEDAVRSGYAADKDTRLAITVAKSCGVDPSFGWLAEHVDQVLAVYPDHPELLKSAAKTFMADGSSDRAAEMLRRLYERDAEAADALAEELGFIRQTDWSHNYGQEETQ